MPRPRQSQYGSEDIYPVIQSSQFAELITFEECGITYPHPDYKLKRNNCLLTCIEYVESGEGVVHADSTCFYPSAGDTYMLHVGENQYYWSDKSNPWKKYWINIKGSNFKKLLDVFKLNNSHHFPGLDIKAELLEIIETAKNATGDHTIQYLEILNRILLKMYEYNSCQTHTSTAMQIREYIDLHVSDIFSLSELEEKFGKSRSQIIRLFKKEYGMTPYAYHLDKRIEVAKNLLTGTKMKVKDVGESLNFYDEHYFRNTFMKKTGVSPTKFRSQVIK